MAEGALAAAETDAQAAEAAKNNVMYYYGSPYGSSSSYGGYNSYNSGYNSYYNPVPNYNSYDYTGKSFNSFNGYMNHNMGYNTYNWDYSNTN